MLIHNEHANSVSKFYHRLLVILANSKTKSDAHIWEGVLIIVISSSKLAVFKIDIDVSLYIPTHPRIHVSDHLYNMVDALFIWEKNSKVIFSIISVIDGTYISSGIVHIPLPLDLTGDKPTLVQAIEGPPGKK